MLVLPESSLSVMPYFVIQSCSLICSGLKLNCLLWRYGILRAVSRSAGTPRTDYQISFEIDLFCGIIIVCLCRSPSFAWLRVLSLRDNVTTLRHSNASCHVTLVFNNLQPAELADQLTFLEYKTFRRITVGFSSPCFMAFTIFLRQ